MRKRNHAAPDGLLRFRFGLSQRLSELALLAGILITAGFIAGSVAADAERTDALLADPLFPNTLTSAALAQAESKVIVVEGRAVDPDSGALLYTEHHRIAVDESGQFLRATVEYAYPQGQGGQKGQSFARKSLQYNADPAIPRLYFEDFRTLQQTIIEYRNNTLVMLQQSGERRNHTDLEMLGLQRPVVDAGFDRLVIKHWDELMTGESLDFAFLAIERRQWINLSVKRVAQTASRVDFVIRPRNFLLRMVLADIKLSYDRVNHRLLSYEGITNIDQVDADGVATQQFTAFIEYEYSEENALK